VNNWTRKRKARGFTLVELLIVIVIIGILAGSMLLVFGSATDKAKASKIVANLRSLKAAALMCYTDYGEWPTSIESLDSYMDRTVPSETEGSETYYSVPDSTTASPWYIQATLQGDDATRGVQDRLADMAVDAGLFSDPECSTDYASGADVYVKVSN